MWDRSPESGWRRLCNWDVVRGNMATKASKAILDRVDTWPQQAEDDHAEMALEIDAGCKGEYHATPDELKAIDAAIEAVRRGEVASDAEVEAVFARHRLR